MHVHMGAPYWCLRSINNFLYNRIRFQYQYRHHLFFHNIVLSFLLSILIAATSSSSSTIFTTVVAAAAPMDPTTAVLIRVDQSGLGDFKKIQDAIDSVPSNNSEYVFIWVKPGTYREKIVVLADKPYITLSGTQADNTIITGNDGHDIMDSPTVSIFASDFVGRYLSIQNTFGKSGKAVALRVAGDKAAFYACRFVSYQDTLLDDAGRHYYSNCYIEGGTDFICGNAASLFEKCHIHSVISSGQAAITAQKRDSPWENTGFTFLGCKITGEGVGTVLLGRPWGTHARVVYAFAYMSSAVLAEGWSNWGDTSRESTVLFGEYKCYGPGANTSKRVVWSKDLTNEEVAPYLTKDMIGGRGWLRSAPSNFKKGFSSIHIKSTTTND